MHQSCRTWPINGRSDERTMSVTTIFDGDSSLAIGLMLLQAREANASVAVNKNLPPGEVTVW